MMKMTTFAVGLGLAAQVSIGQTFINSLGNTLYRTTVSGGGASTMSFGVGADLTSMAVNPTTGEIFGAASTDADGDGFFEIYRIDDPMGTPTLSLVGDFLTQNTPSISFVDNGRLLGFQSIPNDPTPSSLIEIDLNAMTQSTIDGNLGVEHQSSGYDPSTGTLFANDKGNASEAALYTVPFNDADVLSQFVGLTGQATINNGGEFFNGTYYQAINTQGGDLLIGSINTTTGEFTEIFSLGTSTNAAVGLAVIPSPGAVALAGVAGIAGLRRRR